MRRACNLCRAPTIVVWYYYSTFITTRYPRAIFVCVRHLQHARQYWGGYILWEHET